MLKNLLILLIRFYQVTVSPLIGPVCRFYPSCSHYAIEAIEKKGVLKGVYLTVKRLLKCAPWHPGGIDFPESEADDPASTDRS